MDSGIGFQIAQCKVLHWFKTVRGGGFQRIRDKRALLLTWINLNPSLEKQFHPFCVWDEISYQLPNFNGAAIEDREWVNNFISNFIGLIHAGIQVNP